MSPPDRPAFAARFARILQKLRGLMFGYPYNLPNDPHEETHEERALRKTPAPSQYDEITERRVRAHRNALLLDIREKNRMPTPTEASMLQLFAEILNEPLSWTPDTTDVPTLKEEPNVP